MYFAHLHFSVGLNNRNHESYVYSYTALTWINTNTKMYKTADFLCMGTCLLAGMWTCIANLSTGSKKVEKMLHLNTFTIDLCFYLNFVFTIIAMVRSSARRFVFIVFPASLCKAFHHVVFICTCSHVIMNITIRNVFMCI